MLGLALAVHFAVAGLAGVTLAVKVRAACAQLGVDQTDLTVPAALQACNLVTCRL